MISNRDLEILNGRKSTLENKIGWHKEMLGELEKELNGINEIIKRNK
jgi:hypothetical protein